VRLDELVSHSLLRVAETWRAASRCSTFEPVREYAALQFDAGAARALRVRHRPWLTEWANALPPTPSLAEVRIETPNLLAALASALADDVPQDAIRLMLPLRRVLENVELPADGLASLTQPVERCADAALRSQGHTLLAPLLFIAGENDHTIPPGVNHRNYERYSHGSASIADYILFGARNHYEIVCGRDWQLVADAALNWAERRIAELTPAL